MGAFEYKTHIKYQDIGEDRTISNKGILNILSEAAGVHSMVVRVWTKRYRKNRIHMDATILENKSYTEDHYGMQK